MRQKHLAHVGTVVDVRIDQTGDDELAPRIHNLRARRQARRSFGSTPYSADDVALNENSGVGEWCFPGSVNQRCALNQKSCGIRFRQAQEQACHEPDQTESYTSAHASS